VGADLGRRTLSPTPSYPREKFIPPPFEEESFTFALPLPLHPVLSIS